MIPIELRSYNAPSRRRLLEMLVQGVPFLLGVDKVEDHHALEELQERLGCDVAEARLLLKLAINEFPSLKIVCTGAL